MARRNFDIGIAVIMGVLLALLSSGADAVDVSKSDSAGQCLSDPYGCPCDEKLSELPITAPQGMSLSSVNGCSKTSGNYFLGEFVFKGEATISGEIERKEGDMFGDTIYFRAKRAGKYTQFAGAIYALKFSGTAEVISKFKLPELSDKSRCWVADVVIKVRRLRVVSGDTDEAGNYAEDFDVLKTGEYRKCRVQ